MFADFMGGEISDHVEQLRQLYSKHLTTSGYINVEVVPVQKQPNGSDCGAYASAFAFEWALGSTMQHGSQI